MPARAGKVTIVAGVNWNVLKTFSAVTSVTSSAKKKETASMRKVLLLHSWKEN